MKLGHKLFKASGVKGQYDKISVPEGFLRFITGKIDHIALNSAMVMYPVAYDLVCQSTGLVRIVKPYHSADILARKLGDKLPAEVIRTAAYVSDIQPFTVHCHCPFKLILLLYIMQ